MNTVGLLALVHGMRAYLKAAPETKSLGITVTAAGWKQRWQQLNQGTGGANRIVLYPGLEPGGAAGAGGILTREHRPSTTNPRALLTWEKLITMSVWGVDNSSSTATDDEEKQINATEQLLEYAVRAVHNAVDPDTGSPVGVANIEWGPVRWTVPPTEMRFGNEILVEFTQKGPLFDATIDMVVPQPRIHRVPAT